MRAKEGRSLGGVLGVPSIMLKEGVGGGKI